MEKCTGCLVPSGTRCEGSPGNCEHRFTHVALKIDDVIYTAPAPKRHYHIYKILNAQGIDIYDQEHEIGFIHNGEFVHRMDALKIAKQYNTQLSNSQYNMLSSFDLW
jgi:hypothetical protein